MLGAEAALVLIPSSSPEAGGQDPPHCPSSHLWTGRCWGEPGWKAGDELCLPHSGGSATTQSLLAERCQETRTSSQLSARCSPSDCKHPSLLSQGWVSPWSGTVTARGQRAGGAGVAEPPAEAPCPRWKVIFGDSRSTAGTYSFHS